MSAAQMGACAMANQSRKKGGKRAFGKTLIRLFFVLMLLSMLAAYISNQVTISSKRAELETLNEQIAQQQTENQEMQRILSGDADQITEWVARDSYNYAAPNERIFVDVTGKVGRTRLLQLCRAQRAHFCGRDGQMSRAAGAF